MPTYVYRCPACTTEQEEIHRHDADPVIYCECGEVMRRKPQAFRWGFSSYDILLDKLDRGFRDYKGREKRKRKHVHSN